MHIYYIIIKIFLGENFQLDSYLQKIILGKQILYIKLHKILKRKDLQGRWRYTTSTIFRHFLIPLPFYPRGHIL